MGTAFFFFELKHSFGHIVPPLEVAADFFGVCKRRAGMLSFSFFWGAVKFYFHFCILFFWGLYKARRHAIIFARMKRCSVMMLCVCVWTHTHVSTWTHTHTHTHTHKYANVYMHVHMHIRIRIDFFFDVHTYGHAPASICPSMHIWC